MIIGYTTGVYDLFHIGHLTLLKNAKGLCDKLIVGVTVDELVLYKGKHAMIPYSDRVEIVRSIKYVDAVVPQYDMDKLAACKKLGATLLEALSCGCVPVGTPVSGFNDLIKNGQNGFVAKDFSDVEFEKAIINAKNSYKQVSKDKLKKEFNQKYSMGICAKKYESYFEDVILNKNIS